MAEKNQNNDIIFYTSSVTEEYSVTAQSQFNSLTNDN